MKKGRPKPVGNCSICKKKMATQWFRETEIALCSDIKCEIINLHMWEQQHMDLEDEEEYR